MALENFFFLIPALGLGIVVPTHILLMRTLKTMRPYSAYRVAALLGLCVVLWADAAAKSPVFSPAWSDRALPDILAYGALVYTYFHVFNITETGRRMRLMIELYLAPNDLTEDELLERYSAEDVVRLRVERLLSAGQIVERGGCFYRAKLSLGFASQVILLLKSLVMGQLSEFDEKA